MVSRAESLTTSGAHNPERATPILGLCHGVFTDQFSFRHILGHFFPRKQNLHHVYERIRSKKYQKGKLNVNKRHKIAFLGLQVLLTGLWNFNDIQSSRQNHSKTKLVCVNAVTRAHRSCSFTVYCFVCHKWYKAKKYIIIQTLMARKPKRSHWAYKEWAPSVR